MKNDPQVQGAGTEGACLSGINLELTNECPFRCPQCYVPFDGKPSVLPKERAVYWIREAHRNGIRYVNMSGGETLCYPDLEALVAQCAGLGMKASVSVSGAFATKDRLKGLYDAGIGSICVSLNASTPEINSRTRQGYEEALRALGMLKEIPGSVRAVNYVMHASNAQDLGAMLKLLEEYEVQALIILGTLPAADGTLPDPPAAWQTAQAAEVLKNYNGPVQWLVDSCFYELRRLVPDSALDALGGVCGCTAGRTHLSVTTKGLLSPCNHISCAESFDSIEEYLESSRCVRRIRDMLLKDPGCRPCIL